MESHEFFSNNVVDLGLLRADYAKLYFVSGGISGTITVGGPQPQPRKSALKGGGGKSSSFHAHLPPPEFADLPSPPPSIAGTYMHCINNSYLTKDTNLQI